MVINLPAELTLSAVRLVCCYGLFVLPLPSVGGFRVGDSAPSGGWPNGSRDPLTPLSVVIAAQTNPLGSPLDGVDGPAATRSLPDPPLLPPRLLCC